MLSQVARFVDIRMLEIQNLGYDSWQTVYFQRFSVIFTELILVYSLHKYVFLNPRDLQLTPSRFVHTTPVSDRKLSHAAALSILLSPGLLIIDHIHFQYNGAMYGLLVLSLVLARQQETMLLSGLIFAALLCFKHIYLYLAPAYFVYLLRAYCLSQKSIFRIRFSNCVKLGVGIATVFGLALGPYVYWGQIGQLLSRLFPFSRGLCHAYWAPNIWAIYSFTDRIMIFVAPRLGIPVKEDALNSVTRGLVGDTSFAVLPEVTPKMTFALTLLFQSVFLLALTSSIYH